MAGIRLAMNILKRAESGAKVNMFEIEKITKSYGKKQVLKDISLYIETGEIIGILGENGSGKSTLLSILAGLTSADGGIFTMKGKDLLKNAALRQKQVAYVPQDNPLIDELSAYDNLRMWYSSHQLKQQLQGGLFSLLDIDDFLKVPVAKMSGGMKKRLTIACAMASSPSLLLLDEPTAALDLACKDRIYSYFAKIRSEGASMLIATHELQEIELCDRCFIIKNGVLSSYTYDGDVDALVGRL